MAPLDDQQRKPLRRADGSIIEGQPDIPRPSELTRMLKNEAQRPPAPGKQTQHYPVFNSVVDLLTVYGVDPTTFATTDGVIQTIGEQARAIIEQAARLIAAQPPSEPQLRALHAVYDYLTEEDSPHLSDLILLFTSTSLARAQTTAELYAHGIAPTILISGSSPSYVDGVANEAIIYRDFLLANGVPQSAIILEPNSTSIPDNVRSSLNLLDKLSLRPQRITLVISPFAQRRATTTMQKYVQAGATLYRINSGQEAELGRDVWHRNTTSAQIILSEFAKMRMSVAHNSS